MILMSTITIQYRCAVTSATMLDHMFLEVTVVYLCID